MKSAGTENLMVSKGELPDSSPRLTPHNCRRSDRTQFPTSVTKAERPERRGFSVIHERGLISGIEYRLRTTARQWWSEARRVAPALKGAGKISPCRFSYRGWQPHPSRQIFLPAWVRLSAGRKAAHQKTGRWIMGNYLCISWQGFIQQVVYQISRGYYWYCLVAYPETKQDRWPRIDKKLIEKYSADLSKDQRYRRKAKGVANFMFLRWGHFAVILHTQGIGQVSDRDHFDDIRKKPLEVRLNLGYRIHFGSNGVTVHFDRESYQGVKEILADAVRLHNPRLLKLEFDRLNGIPCWSGVVEQKRQLLAFALRAARKNGLVVKREEFRFNTRRKVYKVFEGE